MGNYSKSKLKLKRIIPIFILILSLILIISLIFIIYINVKNTIVIENIDESAKSVSDEKCILENYSLT